MGPGIRQTKVPQVGVSKRAASGSVAALLGREASEPGVVTRVETGGGSVVLPSTVSGVGATLISIGAAIGTGAIPVRDQSTGKIVDYAPLTGGDIAVNATDGDTISGKRTLSGVLLGVGTAAIVTGVVLFVLNKKSASTAQAAPTSAPHLPPAQFGYTPAVFAAR